MTRWLIPQGPMPPRKGLIYYGIDLGTTYTLVAYVDAADLAGSIEQIPIHFHPFEQRSPLPMDVQEENIFVASAIALDTQNRPFVGNRVYHLKGSPLFERYRNLFYHFKLDLGTNAWAAWYRNAQHEDYNQPAKLTGKLLNFCRRQVLGEDNEWQHVVITVPASFQHAQRQDVLQAANYARITHDNNLLADEPNAALVGYLNECPVELRVDLVGQHAETTWLVIDFGGGTCDLSVLEVIYRVNDGLLVRNEAISRYQDVGGQDLDRLLVEMFILDGVHLPAEERQRHLTIEKLCALAERAKILLARQLASVGPVADWPRLLPSLRDRSVTLSGAELPSGQIVDVRLNAGQLWQATQRLFEHTPIELHSIEKKLTTLPSMVNDILEKSNKKLNQITHVLLVGGSVQNPWFVLEAKKMFTNSNVILPATPDMMVAKGAALISLFRHGLKKDLIRPVLSDTVGVITREGFFPLAECGKPLPLKSRVGGFKAQSSLQTEIVVPVCMCSEEFVIGTLNISLKDFWVPETDIALELAINEEKIIEVALLWNGILKGKIKVDAPTEPVNMSREQRLERALQQSLSSKNIANQKRLLKKLMSEYFYQNNYQRLADTAEKYLKEYDQTDPSVLNYAYLGFDGIGFKKKAGQYLKEALKREPMAAYLHHNYSLWLEREEGPAAALAHLDQLPESLSEEPSLRMRRALLLHQLNKNKEAQKLMQQLIEEFKQGRWSIHSSSDAIKMRRIGSIMGEKLIIKDPECIDTDDNFGVEFISEDSLLRGPQALRRNSGED